MSPSSNATTVHGTSPRPDQRAAAECGPALLVTALMRVTQIQLLIL